MCAIVPVTDRYSRDGECLGKADRRRRLAVQIGPRMRRRARNLKAPTYWLNEVMSTVVGIGDAVGPGVGTSVGAGVGMGVGEGVVEKRWRRVRIERASSCGGAR